MFCLAFGLFLWTQKAQAQTVVFVKDSLEINKLNPKDSIPVDSLNKAKNSLVSREAVDMKIDYQCKDSMMFSMADGQMYLYGTGVITTEDKKIQADYIKIETDKSTFFAKGSIDSTGTEVGKPIFEDGKENFKADSMKYNFKTDKGLVSGVKTKYDEGYIHGEITKRQPNKEIHIADGKYTTCDLDHPHFYFHLEKAKVIPDEKTVTGPLWLVVADIPLPFVGLPFGFIPRPKRDASGFLIPEYGEENRRGFYLRNGGYYFAINDYMNAAFRGEIYSLGSWGLSSQMNFKKLYKYSGNLDVRYNKNLENEKETPNFKAIQTFWVTGNYTQDGKANPYQNFSANLNFGSSKDVTYNAVNIESYSNNQKSSSISYRRSRPGGRFNLTANINATQNTSTAMTNLSLPVIAVNMNRWQPAKNVSGKNKLWLKNFGVGFNTNFKNDVNIADSLLFTKEALYEMRNGLQYSVPIGTSFRLLKYLSITPSFSYSGRLYTNYVEKHIAYIPNSSGALVETVAVDTIPGIRHPFDYGVSVPLSTKIFGIYKGSGKHQSALRHVITPSVGYSYRPDFSEEKWGYYSYYREDKDPKSLYSYYDLGVYGKPSSGKSGAVNFSLGNNFELKTKTKRDTTEESFTKIKLLDNLNMSASYNLAADSMNWSMINVSGNTRLFDIVSISYSSSYDPYARDTTGARINVLEWDMNRQIARMSNSRLSINGTFQSKKKTAEGSKKLPPQRNTMPVGPVGVAPGLYAYPDIEYANFDVPWSLSFGYTFNVTNLFDATLQEYVLKPTQTLNANATLNLTSNWRFSARADYDFKARELTHTNISVYRDLHCWEMSFSAIPFGYLKSYTFRLNIKSTIFEGIEYKKEKSWHDNL